MSDHPPYCGIPILFELTVWLGTLQDRLAGDIAELLEQVGLQVSFGQVHIEFAFIPHIDGEYQITVYYFSQG